MDYNLPLDDSIFDIIDDLDIQDILSFFSVNRKRYVDNLVILRHICIVKHLPFVSTFKDLAYIAKMEHIKIFAYALELEDKRLIDYYSGLYPYIDAVRTLIEEDRYSIIESIAEKYHIDYYERFGPSKSPNNPIRQYLVFNQRNNGEKLTIDKIIEKVYHKYGLPNKSLKQLAKEFRNIFIRDSFLEGDYLWSLWDVCTEGYFEVVRFFVEEANVKIDEEFVDLDLRKQSPDYIYEYLILMYQNGYL